MITIGSSCGGIGDNLIFTPIFHSIPVKFEMLEHPKCRNVSKLIEDICTIEFVPNPKACPENTSKSFNIILKKLHGLNLNTPPIPKINIKEDDLNWANDFISQYSNPIIFVGDNNGNHDPNDHFAKYRVPDRSFLQNCVNRLSEKYTILHFGLSNKMTFFDNVTRIENLEITKLAASYKIIGKYFGIDTGDYWLTIATGGKAEVICPDSTHFYNHDEWHLRPEMWWAEPIRIRYVDFNLTSRYQNQIDSFLN